MELMIHACMQEKLCDEGWQVWPLPLRIKSADSAVHDSYSRRMCPRYIINLELPIGVLHVYAEVYKTYIHLPLVITVCNKLTVLTAHYFLVRIIICSFLKGKCSLLHNKSDAYTQERVWRWKHSQKSLYSPIRGRMKPPNIIGAGWNRPI